MTLSLDEYIARFPNPQAGPCAGCGAEGYNLSMGGPGICPACDTFPPEKRLRQIADENRRLRALLESLPGGAEALAAAGAHQHAEWLARWQG